MGRWYSERPVQRMIAEAVAPWAARVAALEAEVARLKSDSSNSSKPPSSDLVKPPRPPTPGGTAKIGGPPGHPRHEREDLPPEHVDRFQRHHLERCPDCGHPVQRTGKIAQTLQ